MAHRLLKNIVPPLFVAGFFVAYFWLLRHPHFPVVAMPLHAPDRLIPFFPLALIPYVSLWIYIFIAPAFLRGWEELWAYSAGVTLITVVGLGLFFFRPTMVPPGLLDAAQRAQLGFLRDIDLAGNACPSLHVAFAVFTAIWHERLRREFVAPRWLGVVNVAWCAAIAYSTVAIRQHVTVDVIAGTALGLAGGMWHPREVGRFPPPQRRWFNRQNLAFLLSLFMKLLIPTLGLWPDHAGWCVLLFTMPDCWIVSGLLVPNTPWLLPVARDFVTDRREVWLTIDDGPDPATTPALLDLLDRHRARATFFLIGEKAAAHPELVRAIARRGHSLGNHTHTHPLAMFWAAGPSRTRREIDRCADALASAGAGPVRWFRPPVGIRNLFLRGVLDRSQLALIGWTSRGREQFSPTPDRPLRRLRRRIRPGAILLVHESSRHPEQRIDLISRLLDHLAAEGYRCVLPEVSALR